MRPTSDAMARLREKNMSRDERSNYGIRPVVVSAGNADLEGDLAVSGDARGIVLFAHGSGSSRKSPRNRAVARTLQEAGLATLLLDLLTPDEERVDVVTRRLRFDIPLLAERVKGTIDWVSSQPALVRLALGVFGASTGAAAALIAAADRPTAVHAVVSRGGRPDLAGTALGRVRAPTLAIVGGRDTEVIALNEAALSEMTCTRRLEIVPGATHLFEEPGALEQVADRAVLWFHRHLQPRPEAGAVPEVP
jgi:putative phosphoribosyl transferase